MEYSAVDIKFSDDEYSMTFILPGENMPANDFVTGSSEKEFYRIFVVFMIMCCACVSAFL